MIQIILIGVIVLALGGAFWSYSHGQQQLGEAKAVAEYERQQKLAAQENERIAAEGKAAAFRLVEQEKTRRKTAEARAATEVLARKEASDVRAREDREYSLWRESALPRFTVDRLRAAVQLAAADPGSNSLPARANLPAATSVPAAAGASDESFFRRLRSRLGGSN